MDVEEYTLKDLLSRIVDNRGRTCPTAETGTALIARDKQTTGLGHFTAGDMRRLMVFKPKSPLLDHFNTAVSSIYSRGYGNRLATKTLTKLRDTLLPELISGELRIPEAEQLTEKALG